MTTTMIRVLLDTSRMTAADTLARANAVHAGLNLNPAYSDPPIPLPVLRTAIDDYSAASTAALDGGAKAIAYRNTLGETLRKMLRPLAHYVEANCNNDMTTLLSSGFQAVSNTRTRTHPVSESIRKIDHGASGEFLVVLVAMTGAVSYELRWAAVASGGSPGEWTNIALAQTRTSVSGLSPGTSYVFQARALTRSGMTDWSQSVSRTCT